MLFPVEHGDSGTGQVCECPLTPKERLEAEYNLHGPLAALRFHFGF